MSPVPPRWDVAENPLQSDEVSGLSGSANDPDNQVASRPANRFPNT